MKGIFIKKPVLPKNIFTYDVWNAIKYSGGLDMSISKKLTLKTIFLLAVLCGQRVNVILTVINVSKKILFW